MYREIIHNYMQEHMEVMVEDLKTLIRVESVKGIKKEGKPFGDGPAHAIHVAENMLQTYGFETKNYENYVLTAQMNELPLKLDILAHLDVVGGGNGWTYTTPFDPKMMDGNLYGRGAMDDKGPIIAALYALRALKELAIPLKHGIRLILGSDEESGSSDLAYFKTCSSFSEMTISPDAVFPLINIEKGLLPGEFYATYSNNLKVPRIVSLQGGSAFNVIPEQAVAIVEGLNLDELEKVRSIEKQKEAIFFRQVGNNAQVEIIVEGKAAHSSEPQEGLNAITLLLSFIQKLPLADIPVNRYIKDMAGIFLHEDYHGKAIGINVGDLQSGETTISLNEIKLDETHFLATFDCRTSLLANQENTIRILENKFKQLGFEHKELKLYPPHYVSTDSDFVKTLMECYKNMTGLEHEPKPSGGATYVHWIENGVAFGCMDPSIDNFIHGADEFITIDQLLLSAEIYADAIIRLCA